jgi:phosphoribosylglycinamide formyltransferase-1
MEQTIKIALFASGSGTNVENIVNFFKGHGTIETTMVLTNKKDAYVIQRAEQLGLPCSVFNRQQFYESNEVVNLLLENDIDCIVLAGFLWFIPQKLLDAFPRKMINIHPALLPNYGGKGMYGDNVHKAVVANKEKETGITIHHVNEHYDEGEVIYQATCEVLPNDTYEMVAQKVHALEYKWFPIIIEKWLLNQPIEKTF